MMQAYTVIFEEHDIRTDDSTSDFVLSMMAAVAQDESHSISMNVQLAYENRFTRGEYNLGNNRILGYDCVDGVLVPRVCLKNSLIRNFGGFCAISASQGST